ncbi:MAG: Ig-like domain-containing protein [Gemmatimonadetes bacterium]|nr:Ig-like domain-containing protein [Gemmatimonadota bacterium]
MRLIRSLRMLAVVPFLASCGGGGDNGGTNPPPPAVTLGSITPSTTTLSLGAGQSQTLTVTARDANNNTITATGYSFSSSAAAVAVVSTGGRVTGLTAGTATITVSLTLNGVTKTATVAVTVAGTLPTSATVAAGSNTNDFTPDLVAIARGGTVTWTFGATAHNVEFGSTPGAPQGVGNSQNTQATRTFANAGSFAYTCTLHSGQNGAVLVP